MEGLAPADQQGVHRCRTDDRIVGHALAWAAYSLRSITLNPYEIEGIHCNGRGADVEMCALNGGGHLPFCGQACRSMKEAGRLYGAYLARKPLTPVGFEAFIANKLKKAGATQLLEATQQPPAGASA